MSSVPTSDSRVSRTNRKACRCFSSISGLEQSKSLIVHITGARISLKNLFIKDFIPLGDVAARDVAIIDINCGRCDRHGRLSVKRLLDRYGADVAARHRSRADRFLPAPGRCTTRCTPYCPRGARVWLRAGGGIRGLFRAALQQISQGSANE